MDHVKDHAGEEIVRGQVPMIAAGVAGRIDQHVRDVLRVLDLLGTQAAVAVLVELIHHALGGGRRTDAEAQIRIAQRAQHQQNDEQGDE